MTALNKLYANGDLVKLTESYGWKRKKLREPKEKVRMTERKTSGDRKKIQVAEWNNSLGDQRKS